MYVGCAPLDGIEQHLVDETDDRCVFDIVPGYVVALLLAGSNLEILEVEIVVFQPGAEISDGGTKPEDGAIRWIGANGKSGDLRIEVHTRSEAEVPFKLGLISAAPLAQP